MCGAVIGRARPARLRRGTVQPTQAKCLERKEQENGLLAHNHHFEVRHSRNTIRILPRGSAGMHGQVLPPCIYAVCVPALCAQIAACGPRVNMPRISGIGRKKKKKKTAAEVAVGVEAAAEGEVPDKIEARREKRSRSSRKKAPPCPPPLQPPIHVFTQPVQTLRRARRRCAPSSTSTRVV